MLLQQESKRSDKDLAGRNESNTRVIFPKAELPTNRETMELKSILPGDYVAVQVCILPTDHLECMQAHTQGDGVAQLVDHQTPDSMTSMARVWTLSGAPKKCQVKNVLTRCWCAQPPCVYARKIMITYAR